MIKKIVLQKGKEKSLQRFHPWVFSGAIAKQDHSIYDGDVVEVYDFANQYLATGHYHNSSTCVKIFSFDKIVPDDAFWKMKVANAIDYRHTIGLIDHPKTNIFRLINGEGDGLPGLIVDWFDGNVVIQFHSYGMYLLKETFVQILTDLFQNKIKSIYNKSVATLPEIKSFEPVDELLYGSFDEVLVNENGIPFYIDIVKGQKTGFFIDQRDNRKMVGEYAKGKDVLNLFSYTGGFSGYALAGGANRVHSVDISKKAIDFAEKNIAVLGKKYLEKHESFTENVFDFLENADDKRYDVIVLDPPAFAKHHKVKDQRLSEFKPKSHAKSKRWRIIVYFFLLSGNFQGRFSNDCLFGSCHGKQKSSSCQALRSRTRSPR